MAKEPVKNTPYQEEDQREPFLPEAEPGNQPHREPGNDLVFPDVDRPPRRKEGVVSDPDW